MATGISPTKEAIEYAVAIGKGQYKAGIFVIENKNVVLAEDGLIDWPAGEKNHNSPCLNNSCFKEFLDRFGAGKMQFAYVLIHLKSTENDGDVPKPQNKLIFCTYCDDEGSRMSKFKYAGSKTSVVTAFNFGGTMFQFNGESEMCNAENWMEEFDSKCVKGNLVSFEGCSKECWGDE